MASREEFILVGKLGRRRGVAGEIYVTPSTDFPDRFLDLDEIFVESHGSWRKLTIEASRLIGNRPVLKFVGIELPEEVSKLTNRQLAVTSDQLIDLPEDTYFVFDLVGCEVIDQETGQKVGEVIDVQRYPANDVYVIKSVEGKEILLPAVAEYVKQVEIDQRRIVVEKSGLFE